MKWRVILIFIGLLFVQTIIGAPGDLLWATYYGGSSDDNCDGQREVGSVFVDNLGNIYITGFTKSTNFPIYNPGTGAYFQATNFGQADVFVAKFSPNGQLLWATYYGGSSDDIGLAITSDHNCNIIVCGITFSSNFPLYNPGGNTYYQGYTGGGDGFIIKFDSLGRRLWATCFGGGLSDVIYAVATDFQGNIFIAGNSYSSNLPVYNPGGNAYYQSTNAGSFDGFLAKFSSFGERLWATYYGGGDEDHVYAIDVDSLGNLFATGMTRSSNFPTYNPGGNAYYQGTLVGYRSAFILKFSSFGERLWATYYGGNSNDYGRNIRSCINGTVFVVGNTSSTNFPTYNPGGNVYFQGTNAGSDDLFILKFNSFGERLWATYYGGLYADIARSISTTATGGIYLTGNTLSSNFPTYPPSSGGYFQGTIAGGHEAFIVSFDENCAVRWATFYGGASTDYGMSITTDNSNNIVLTGFTLSTNFPTYNPGGNIYYQGSNAGRYDAFVAKFQGFNLAIADNKDLIKNTTDDIYCPTFFRTNVTIRLPCTIGTKVQLKIFDSTGKIVLEKVFSHCNELTIYNSEFSHFKAGVYLLKIQTDNITFGLKKIIKL
ncbi:MAG: SBBP repeat-containing protein [candidate division WOR-3 bacterium]|nr:SBBP repeat-containing protein [candidate division WOR-3 bacterium]